MVHKKNDTIQNKFVSVIKVLHMLD